ncbi:MAG: class I SAM-dependent methyltransferase [Acidisphaera sp.]|nr:class I SAM-dependent methyltransferase [Acidisphaera sp.]
MQVADLNRRVYERPGVARYYAAQDGLHAAEVAILQRYAGDIRGGSVLDLGVGGGRTTPHLASLARRYVGVDFSAAMVAACGRRFSQHEFRQADVRDLSEFPPQSFDFVLFSFSGIDALDDAGRSQALREIARILKPGGVLAFSSHNLRHAGQARFFREIFRVPVTVHPGRILRSLFRVSVRLCNYCAGLLHNRREARYALLHDPGSDFAAPHYYVDIPEQRRQLARAGFTGPTQIFDESGNEVGPRGNDCSATLHYVTRKP